MTLFLFALLIVGAALAFMYYARGVYETPGGAILYRAHKVLETITLDRDTQHYKKLVSERFAELVYFGQWFTPLREALSAFVDKTQETVTGDVKLKLYKGNMINAGVTSPYSLYDEEIATFDEDEVYDQKDSAGFINLFGLPIAVRAKAQKRFEDNYEMIFVVNFYRPLTRTADEALEIMREIEAASGIKFNCIVNNSNIGSETSRWWYPLLG